MKIIRLDLERFGHFRGQQLAFGEGTRSRMCLVQGDNEAGKTTVLEAIRALIFGVPKKGRYGVHTSDDDEPKVNVSAHVELDRGMALDLQRTSGRGETLHGRVVGTGDEVDTEWLGTRLGHPTRAIFESVFAFSLDALARGADALAHDEVKNAIYGSGLGGAVQPTEILADLRGRAQALFAPQASKPKINATAAKVESLRKQIRNTTTRSDQYRQLAEDLQRKQRAADARADESRKLREAVDRARALRDGIEPHRALRVAERELHDLAPSVPASLAEDEATPFRRALETRERLRAELDEWNGQRAHLVTALGSLAVNDTLLAEAAAIDALHRGLDRHRATLEEHPRATDERAALLASLGERLAAARPGWDLERLRETRFETARVTELVAALDEHDARTRDLDECARDEHNHRIALAELDAKLADLPPGEGRTAIAALVTWLEGWSGHQADVGQHTKLTKELRDLEKKLDRSRAQLDPPFAGDPDRLASLGVPRDAEVARFERELATIEQSIERAEEQVEATRDALERVATELAASEASAPAPAEEDLRALREKRDERWSAIAAGKTKPSRTAVAGFERSMTAADDAADRMRLFAEAVQRRAQLRVAHASHDTRHREAVKRRDAASAEVTAWRARWVALWKRAGIAPLAPDEMRAWLRNRETHVELLTQRTRLLDEQSELAARLVPFVERARSLLRDSDATLDDARNAARARVAADERRARDAAALEAQRTHHRTRVEALAKRRLALEDDLRTTAARVPTSLHALGLEPIGSIQATRAVLDELVSVRKELVARARPLDDRIARLGDEVEQYETRVLALASARSVESSEAVGDIVAELHARVVTTRDALARRDEKRHALLDLDARVDAATRALVRAEDEIADKRRLAGVGDDESFLHLAAARDRCAFLTRVVADRRHELQRLARTMPFDTYLEALDAGLLASELDIERDEREAERIAAEVRELDVELGALKTRKTQIETSEGAATLLADLELERSSIRDDVERYAVLTLAEQILRDAIARFEREHQPALLARASTIFEEMTMGRHRAVRRNLDGSVVVERDDGRTLVPEALSTGTREQLFLAIRLAYVDHYRRNAESLPVVLDDVLVNFDDHRAAATLSALSTFARETQVLLFTCHPHLIALAERAGVDAARVVMQTHDARA